jgi:hypothetical protein
MVGDSFLMAKEKRVIKDTGTILNLALLCHLIGDYLLQSDWMATEKTKKSTAALAHVLTYGLPFLLLTHSISALFVIVGTHFIIDRWRLARYVVWAKNYIAPWIRRKKLGPDGRPWECLCGMNRPYLCFCKANETELVPPTKPWKECTATGYDPERPLWLTVWLLIIADNTMHLCINALALIYLR